MTNSYLDSWSHHSKIWLNQFSTSEKEFANALINELIIEDTFKIQKSVREKFQEIVKEVENSNTKLIILPITDIKYKDNRPHAAFVDIDIQKDLPITPGSEAQIAHWIRNQHLILNESLNEIILSEVNFGKIYKHLKNGSAIRFICITDYSLSGEEVVNFIKPIQSLIKYFEADYSKKLKIEVLCHAVSKKSIERIGLSGIPVGIYFTKYLKTLDNCFWLSESLVANIKSICHEYTKHLTDLGTIIDDSHRYGYKDTFSLTITDSFVPDNTPSLLWKDIKDRYKSDFSPLIPNRYSLIPSRSSKINNQSKVEIIKKLHLSKIQNFLLLRERTQRRFVINLVLLLLKKYDYLLFSQICILFDSPVNQMKLILDSAKNNSLLEYSRNPEEIQYDWKVLITEAGHEWLEEKRFTPTNQPRSYNIPRRKRGQLDRNDHLSYYRY